MFNKIISIALSVVMVMGMTTSAFAETEKNECKTKVINRAYSLSDEKINTIQNAIKGEIVTDGKSVPIDVNVVVEEVKEPFIAITASSVSNSLSKYGKKYRITAMAKSKTAENTNKIRNVATSTLIMEWTDGKWGDNTIDKLYGYTDLISGKITYSKLEWGPSALRVEGRERAGEDVTEIYAYPRYTNSSLHADYIVGLKGRIHMQVSVRPWF